MIEKEKMEDTVKWFTFLKDTEDFITLREFGCESDARHYIKLLIEVGKIPAIDHCILIKGEQQSVGNEVKHDRT